MLFMYIKKNEIDTKTGRLVIERDQKKERNNYRPEL